VITIGAFIHVVNSLYSAQQTFTYMCCAVCIIIIYVYVIYRPRGPVKENRTEVMQTEVRVSLIRAERSKFIRLYKCRSERIAMHRIFHIKIKLIISIIIRHRDACWNRGHGCRAILPQCLAII
jgi:hypothetical protein